MEQGKHAASERSRAAKQKELENTRSAFCYLFSLSSSVRLESIVTHSPFLSLSARSVLRVHVAECVSIDGKSAGWRDHEHKLQSCTFCLLWTNQISR